ncbi:MAG TPA: chemotaxis protein [Candidatus Eisenbacteria bacterium]
MSHPIAIAFIHGIGRTDPGYSAAMQRTLMRRFASRIGADAPNAQAELVFEEINWSAALQYREDRLWRTLVPAGPMRYRRLRRFLVDFAADAIAYQPAPSDRTAYDAIHRQVAAGLARLAERAGPRAPLCLVAHSLGTVIASNYVYDLVKPHNSFMCPSVRALINGTPLERGETLARLFTLGSPIALWSLRYPRFGEPIRFPMPALAQHHPGLEAAWINLYDPDDVVGYPLRPLNAGYRAAVTEDRPIDVGSLLTRWNPLSHVGYWDNGRVADAIAESLAVAWRQSSALALVPPRRRIPGARRRAAPKGRRRAV